MSVNWTEASTYFSAETKSICVIYIVLQLKDMQEEYWESICSSISRFRKSREKKITLKYNTCRDEFVFVVHRFISLISWCVFSCLPNLKSFPLSNQGWLARHNYKCLRTLGRSNKQNYQAAISYDGDSTITMTGNQAQTFLLTSKTTSHLHSQRIRKQIELFQITCLHNFTFGSFLPWTSEFVAKWITLLAHTTAGIWGLPGVRTMTALNHSGTATKWFTFEQLNYQAASPGVNLRELGELLHITAESAPVLARWARKEQELTRRRQATRTPDQKRLFVLWRGRFFELQCSVH